MMPMPCALSSILSSPMEFLSRWMQDPRMLDRVKVKAHAASVSLANKNPVVRGVPLIRDDAHALRALQHFVEPRPASSKRLGPVVPSFRIHFEPSLDASNIQFDVINSTKILYLCRGGEVWTLGAS
jgi:hypothetical protein